ncbi:Reverse transcriptase domain [Arabidopsis suecica]|uniref:Reverse transcriptase domain n=1 Tax=Arabidopsis suecica TaxID=45249 RepID=A0A8T1YME0_ARASU|nr:Reverse transcriptase domain [Arabidopsis suecica]
MKPVDAEASSSDSAIAQACEESPVLDSTDLKIIDAKVSTADSELPLPSVNNLKVGKISEVEATTNPSAKVDKSTDPEKAKTFSVTTTAEENLVPDSKENKVGDESWLKLFKGSSKPLTKKGKPFKLPSGEVCVEIPNSVIEKHQKSWEFFIIGQFYSDPPSQEIIHTIVNGIWSRQFRDISVSKLEGNAFLFKIPNFQTRSRVLNQRLWSIEGQTMFVANWSPGFVPVKPELSSAPIWLELRNVPLQFFNEDGLEHIAGLVGDPKCLHPSTANKSNLEVAKVFTIIDPRKPLPEAVNVKFQSGEIKRILVSSPWMPPICGHCKEIGHTVKHCKSAPISCMGCNSTSHSQDQCPRGKKKKKQLVYRIKPVQASVPAVVASAPPEINVGPKETGVLTATKSTLSGEKLAGVSSGSKSLPVSVGTSEAESDSSDVLSSDPGGSDSSAGEQEDYGFTEVQSKSAKFINALLPGWFCDDNYNFSELGKIWILWHPSVKVSTISKSLQMITCEVELPNAVQPIVVSFVYASNVEVERLLLWDELVNLSKSQSVIGKAWTVVGDFNQTLNPLEHSKSDGFSVDRATLVFRDCLQNASLQDLTFRGCTFTWWNKRLADLIAKKLDRVLVNDEWAVSFPASFGLFSEPDFSDHSCSSITLDAATPFQKKSFKFYNFLLKNQEFFQLISHYWFSFNLVGSDMFRVSKKLRLLKKHIKDFCRNNYSGIEKRVLEAHEVLIQCQSSLLSSPSLLNAAIVLEAEKKWQVLALAEENFFRQRCSISWLADGESNSRYFHRFANSRGSSNHIHYLLNKDGVKVESAQGIQNICVDFFENLLGKDVSPPLFIQDDITSLLSFSCLLDQQSKLSAAFSSQEIMEAFFSLPKHKSSGPDGFPAEFYISCWLLLGERLKTFLPNVISPAQSAFIPGRLLSENVLLATEIMHGYNRSGIDPRGMLKVDLRKAFDSVRWDFIIATLRGLNLPEIFIGWITECISTPTFSVSVNGVSGGFFKNKRVLRQGDPLSPYLFVLSMEVFSKLLLSRYSSGYIYYHPKTSDLEISHLMFADDVMIFFDGGSSSLHGINDTLDDFAGWSGLTMNRDKTELFLAGVDEIESLAIANYGFPQGTLPIRYLGLPLMCRKLKISEYTPLLEKVKGKFSTWAVRSLSYAGRLQLIASVITGTVVFWISTFKLPKGCIREIESLCSRFLWSGGIENYRKAKVAWSKFIWLLFSKSGSLWVAWHKFHHIQRLGGESVSRFWSIQENANDTWNWRCLLRLRPLAVRFLKCVIGNGLNASFWRNNWTPFGPLIKFLGDNGPRNLRLPIASSVAHAIVGNVWTLASPRSQESLSLHIYLTTISLPLNLQEEDLYCWSVNDVDCIGFSSSKTWQVIRQREEEKSLAPSVWFKGATPRNAFHMWISHLDRLPTRSRLLSWGMQVSHLCCLCSADTETRDHLFLNCSFTSALWNMALVRIRQAPLQFQNWDDLLNLTKCRTVAAPSTLRKLVAQAIIYAAWKHRNNMLFNSQLIPPATIFKAIDR